MFVLKINRFLLYLLPNWFNEEPEHLYSWDAGWERACFSSEFKKKKKKETDPHPTNLPYVQRHQESSGHPWLRWILSLTTCPSTAGFLPERATILFFPLARRCPHPHSTLQKAHSGEWCSLRNAVMLIIRASKDTSSSGLNSRALN